jgi:hypothetical protein
MEPKRSIIVQASGALYLGHSAMKIMTFLIAVAVAAPAIAQDTMPASPPAPAAAPSETTYPPCSATVTDQCIERGGGGGHHHRWHKKHK